MDALNQYKIVFCLGVPGSGKTALAISHGVQQYLDGKFKKIILCRPAISSEDFGYLPGMARQKLEPFLVPLFDELYRYFDRCTLEKKIKEGEIEILPLAYARGRTLKDSFVIVDEASNATRAQLIMMLTRFGHGSQMVLVGDPSQSDLGKKSRNDFEDMSKVLSHISDIREIRLGPEDIQREPLVKEMLMMLGNPSV